MLMPDDSMSNTHKGERVNAPRAGLNFQGWEGERYKGGHERPRVGG